MAYHIYWIILNSGRSNLMTGKVQSQLRRFASFIPQIGADLARNGHSDQAITCMCWLMDQYNSQLKSLQRAIEKEKKKELIIKRGVRCLQENGIKYTFQRIKQKAISLVAREK